MRNFWDDNASKDDEDSISNGDGNVNGNDTSNDASIALALAEEYEQQTAAASTSTSTMGLARQQHYSQHQQTQKDSPIGSRNKYNMRSSSSPSSSGGAGAASSSISKGVARPVVQGTRVSERPPFMAPHNTNRPSSQQQNQPSLPSDWKIGQRRRRPQPSHMCYIPCLLGGGGQQDSAVCVEMMVDTGADASVISWGLAQQLHLDTQLDRSQRGIAAGVGTAPILGKLHNVVATVGAGHVEFYMDFLVLDVPEANTGKLLILGMDQLRKYQCLIDLQRNVLIFGGGTDGVEVPMLPAEQVPAYDPRGLLNTDEMCTVS